MSFSGTYLVSILLESKFDLGFYYGNKSYGKILWNGFYMSCHYIEIGFNW